MIATVIILPGTPYTVRPTDALVEFDGSTGTGSLVAYLPAAPGVGEIHAFIWWGWSSPTNYPVINGNGNVMQPYDGAPSSKATVPSTQITSLGGAVTYEWDGTRWLVLRAKEVS